MTDAWSDLRRFWWANFGFALLVAIAFVFVETFRGGEAWRLAAMGVIAALGSVAFVTLAVLFGQASRAPGKLRADDARAEMERLLERGGRDGMFMYLRAALQNPQMAIADACVFGSAVIAYPPPRDVDLAVRFAEVPRREVIQGNRCLVAFAGEFKERFNKPLHLQKFLYHETDRIAQFNFNAELRSSLLGKMWGK